MTPEAFVLWAIQRLRKPPFKGIHATVSGFNAAFRERFGQDPAATTSAMAARGLIEIRPVRGGVVLYLAGDAPPPRARGPARS